MPVILIQIEIPPQIFEKFSSVQFYENTSGGSRIVSCVCTDVKMMFVVSSNNANAPTNQALSKFSEHFHRNATRTVCCVLCVRDGLIDYMDE